MKKNWVGLCPFAWKSICKRMFFSLILFLSVAFYNACSPQKENSIEGYGENVKRLLGMGILRIGQSDTELPWCDRDPDTGELIGYEVEIDKLLLNQINQKLKSNLEIQFVMGDWIDLPNRLIRKRFDIIGNCWTPSEEYQDKILWSVPYHKWGLITAVRADSPYTSIDQLINKPVGRYNDPTSEHVFKEKGFKDVRSYNDGDLAMEELLNGNLEAYIYDSVYLLYAEKNNPDIRVIGEELNESTYNFGIRKGEEDLLELINQCLEEVIVSKEYKEILDRWF